MVVMMKMMYWTVAGGGEEDCSERPGGLTCCGAVPSGRRLMTSRPDRPIRARHPAQARRSPALLPHHVTSGPPSWSCLSVRPAHPYVTSGAWGSRLRVPFASALPDVPSARRGPPPPDVASARPDARFRPAVPPSPTSLPPRVGLPLPTSLPPAPTLAPPSPTSRPPAAARAPPPDVTSARRASRFRPAVPLPPRRHFRPEEGGAAMAAAAPAAAAAAATAAAAAAGAATAATGGCGGCGPACRLPARVLELVFSYLELRELRSCALVCKQWHRCLQGDENSEVWRSLCARRLPADALHTDLLCNLPSYKAKVRAFQHAFSTNDCSRNVYIKKNGFTLHRNPIAQSTDGARTKIGFSEGRHAWEVWWEGPLGTVAVIGIATKKAPMQCQGYVALLGSDDQSWGWNLVDNNLLHNGEVNGSFPQCNNAPKYQIGERIRVILDMEDKTLAFERGYEFLGVAFRGLPKACLYPAVSAVYGNTEVTLVYLGKPLDG
ncbi:F-box/SPRY domain-containing protein 1 [Tachyglossus aculeatus]|nr:F-box/SPRY domain-containing protein 1 [Tachyglossus aculeatus]